MNKTIEEKRKKRRNTKVRKKETKVSSEKKDKTLDC